MNPIGRKSEEICTDEVFARHRRCNSQNDPIVSDPGTQACWKSEKKKSLRERVIDAAEWCLNQDGSVGILDVFMGMRFLEPVHFKSWKKGRSRGQSMTKLIMADYPSCSQDEANNIATHTALRGSGRVGRSAAGRELDPNAIRLAVEAWVRHQHTNYDSLLMKGVERMDARHEIKPAMHTKLKEWTAE